MQADLRILIDNVLDAFNEVDPLKITIKPKLHAFVHTPDDVRQFGPAVCKSTEVQEKYNAIFRHCIVLGNGQADSRNIAQQLGFTAATAHLVTGGYYLDSNQWRQAGAAVTKLLRNKPILQHHLGWVPTKRPSPGRFSGAMLIDYSCFSGSVTKQPTPAGSNKVLWSVEAQSGNTCGLQSWVVARHKVCSLQHLLCATDIWFGHRTCWFGGASLTSH
jgi:hypothetical protein